MLSPEPMSMSPVMVTLPMMLALDGDSVSAPPLTLPLTELPEPMDSEVAAAILPLTVTDDGFSVTVGAVMLPTSELPDASVNAVLAVTLPVRLTGELVVMVVPEIGPMMVTLDEIATVPVFIDAALMLAVMVCACAPTENAPLVLSVPPLTARLDGLMPLMSRSPLVCSDAVPLIVRPWL